MIRHTLLPILWELRAVVGILVGVMVLARLVRSWRKARRHLVIAAACLSLAMTAQAATESCYMAACDSSVQHCEEYDTGGVVTWYCADGPETWYSADQASQGSLRSQWLLAMGCGLLLFIAFSTRFKP